MGAGSLNYRELSQMMEMRTGGMSLSTHISTHHSEMKAFEQVRVGWGGVTHHAYRGRWVGTIILTRVGRLKLLRGSSGCYYKSIRMIREGKATFLLFDGGGGGGEGG